MLAALYSTAVDLPLYEAAWWLAALWLCRSLALWSFFISGCLCCNTCSTCTGTPPAEYQVVLASIAAGTGFSADCPTSGECTPYNGTFVLPRNEVGEGIYQCAWKLDVTSTCNYDTYDANQIVMGIFESAGSYGITILIEKAFNHNGALPALFTWTKGYGATPPICALSGEAINTSGSPAAGHCNWDGSTYPVVTAL